MIDLNREGDHSVVEEFDLKRTSSGKHMLNLKAGNGRIIFTSDL